MKLLRNMDVTVHGQSATILGEYEGMYEVRIWDGSRHVGDIVVPESEIKTEPMINDVVASYLSSHPAD